MEIIFSASWQDHEEGEMVEVMFENGKYFVHRSGHTVWSGDFDSTEEISEMDAFLILEEEAETLEIEM